MKKNDIYELTIDDIGNDGEGIGHIAEGGAESTKGIAVFVKDTVVGDVATVRIIKLKKNYAYGRLMDIVIPSPFRVDSACPNSRRCGGCTLMHMSYDRQLEYKRSKVIGCLERIGGLTDAERITEPVYGMDEPYHYRNKMQFPVGVNRDGQVQIGFYAGRTHDIIDLHSCAIGHPVNDYIVKHLRGWLQKHQNATGAFVYDEESHVGLVRHVLTRVGFTMGELMVCLVINGRRLSDVKGANTKNETHRAEDINEEFIQVLKAACDEYNSTTDNKITLASVTININREKTNRILGDKCFTLYGRDYISDYIGDIKFQISPLSFYQVNPIQTKVLYDKAIEYAGLKGNETVWDMYCGIGTISLCLAKHAGRVYGVEIVPQAIEDAKRNARINGIDNTEFYCGKAEEIVPGFYGSHCGIKNPDVVVVDPPRKGCDSVLLETIVKMSPDRMVYVSCDPATLARDVKYMTEHGYQAERVAVVDQFGHSGHVETVVMLSHKKPDGHINVRKFTGAVSQRK